MLVTFLHTHVGWCAACLCVPMYVVVDQPGRAKKAVYLPAGRIDVPTMRINVTSVFITGAMFDSMLPVPHEANAISTW